MFVGIGLLLQVDDAVLYTTGCLKIQIRRPKTCHRSRCELLGIALASYYRGPPSGLRAGALELMRKIDELYLQHPSMGSRSLADQLTTAEKPIGRDRIRRLMLLMGIQSLSPKPGTSKRHPRHPVFPYLLRGMTIDRPNQVWATDITYIPMAKGFMYLVAIMDWVTIRYCPLCRPACTSASLSQKPDRGGIPATDRVGSRNSVTSLQGIC